MNKVSKVALYLYDRNVIKEICARHGLSQEDAMRSFLFSKTYRMLCDERYAMTDFSYPAIFDIWESETVTGDPRNSAYIRED